MAESPDPKRARTADVPAPESTPVYLHALYCRQSAKNLQRMRRLIKKDPSLLYKVQLPRRLHQKCYNRCRNVPLSEVESPPLWHACQVQHLECVKLILQASGPENVKLLDSFLLKKSYKPKKENLLSYVYTGARRGDTTTTFKIMKALLEHGISPNVETSMAEISEGHTNSEVVKILEQYKTKSVIFPSPALHKAVSLSYPAILELLFEHGAYPDPVILTESGSVLPLYPTLGEHLNPIPHLCHPDIECPDIIDSLLYNIFNFGGADLKRVAFLKTLLVHGASIPHYAKRDQISSKQVLFTFDVINKITTKDRKWQKFRGGAEYIYIWGYKSDGTLCRFYDIILALLKPYHQFGGSLWWKMKSSGEPCEGGTGECVEWLRDPERVTPCKTIIDVIREHIPDPEAQSMVVGEVERMMSIPPSLQHSARLAIRRSMGYGCVRNLEALPLPDGLRKYLEFETE